MVPFILRMGFSIHHLLTLALLDSDRWPEMSGFVMSGKKRVSVIL